MKKKALRFIIWLTGIFLISLLTFVLVLYANRDRIIERVVSEANDILTEPVDMASLDISIRKFPLASIKLNEVYCRGRGSAPSDTLLYAEQIYLEFHLWKLILGDWSIEGISLINGKLKLWLPESGEPNYKIWRDRTDNSQFTVFNLEQVELQNIQLTLAIEKQKVNLLALVNNANFGGQFSSSNYQLHATADFHLNQLIYQDELFLAPEDMLADLDIEGTDHEVTLKNGQLNVQGFDLVFNGNYHPAQFTIEASGAKMDIANLYRFYRKQKWSEEQIKGDINGTGSFRFAGIFPTSQEGPQYEVEFDLAKGSLAQTAVKLTRIEISGSYKRGLKADKMVLNSFRGQGRTGEISGYLSISDLSSPAINLKLISELELEEWMLLLPLDTLINANGRLAVNVDLSNNFESLSDVTAEELRKTQAHGQVELKKVGFGFRKSDKTIENLNASLSFSRDQLAIDNFYFQTGKSDVFLSGHFSNVLGYLFFEKEKLKLAAKVRSKDLHVEDFLLTGTSSNEEYSLDFARSIEMDIAVEVDHLYFDSFYGEQVSGSLSIINDMIRGNNLAFEADQGVFKGDFSINMKRMDNYRLMARLNATNADLHTLFMSFNNFGQSELIADNIHGRADMKLQMTSDLKPNLNLPPESVYLEADLNIVDGILKNYEPMMALSDYADIKELKEVRFSQLSNQISIEESVIYIPEMLIESNVLNLQLSGKHHFDHRIDYSIKLRLADVLFKNRKKASRGSEFDEHLTEMEKTDDPNIYVSMTGTTSYPIISLDKQEMNNSIKEDLKRQGEEFKQIFTKKEPGKNEKKSSGIEYSLFDEPEDGGEN